MRPVARIAQSVEQGIENPRVGGSIPPPGTKRIKVRWLRDEILNGRLIQDPVITKSPCKSGYTVVSVSYPQAWHLLVTGVTLSHTQKCLHHSGPMSSMFIPCQKVPLQNFPVFPFSRYWPHGVFSPL